MTDHAQRTYRLAVEELLDLEARNMRGELDEVGQERRRDLIHKLLAIPRSIVDKRRHLRVRAEQRAELAGAAFDPEARVLSLSGGGLFLATDRAPPIGSEVEVVVHFPERQEVALRFQAAVRWVSTGQGARAEVPPGVGVEFLGVSERQQEAILSVLREELQRQLELAVERYQFFFQHAPDLAALVHRDGSILEFNRGWLLALGIDEERVFGAVVDSFIAPDDRPAWARAVRQVQETGQVQRCEVHLLGPGDGQLPIEALLTSVQTSEIDFGTLVVARDLTERLAVEAERRVLERRLFQADKLASLGRVAASVAHDINNPLACVLSNLALLDEYSGMIETVLRQARGMAANPGQPPDPEILDEISTNLRGVLEDSLVGARRLRDIARDLRTFSRVDDSGPGVVDLNEAVETCLRIVRNQMEQRARIEVVLGELPSTRSNFGKVCQILLCLLANTVHAFPDAPSGKNLVRVRTWREDGVLCVSVEDNGKGVAPEFHELVFEPFTSLAAGGEGLGLGLFVARDVTRALGGELRFDSVLGQGTRAEVRVPLRALVVEQGSRTGDVLEATEHRTILVVDDEEALLRAFERQLRRRWTVLTASSVDAALTLLGRASVDLVISDVMLPGRTGVDLLTAIQEQFPGLERRVLFMTGGAFSERERTLLQRTQAPVVEKPFTMEEMEQRMLALLAAEG
ncbi:MAG: ATP-binding protein [Pseudomonadota bacterium]